jgi:hypothetical protein
MNYRSGYAGILPLGGGEIGEVGPKENSIPGTDHQLMACKSIFAQHFGFFIHSYVGFL